MTIARRHVLRSLLSLTTAAMLPGVSGASSLVARARELAASERVTLELLHPSGCEANLEPAVQAFTAATGIDIRLVPTPVDDMNSRLMLAALSGESFDLALPATFGLPDLVEAGALRPLDSFQRLHGGGDASDRSLYTLGDYYDGQLYGFQTDGDVYVMFYNAAALADDDFARRYRSLYGSEPRPARTWDELDRMMAVYHRPERKRYGGALFRTPGYIAWEWWIRLHAKGVLPFDADMRPQLKRTEAVQATEELVAASRFLTPTARSAGLTENWATFCENDVLCNIGWGGSQKYFRQHAGDKAIVAAVTPGSGSTDFSYFNWGWNFAVPRNSRHPEPAYLFARFAVGKEISAAAVAAPGGFFDPYRNAHYDNADIRRIYGEQFLDVHRTSMRQAMPDLYLRGRNLYFRALSDYLLAVDSREATPTAALLGIHRRWEEITDELGRRDQIRQWRLLMQRYPVAFQSG